MPPAKKPVSREVEVFHEVTFRIRSFGKPDTVRADIARVAKAELGHSFGADHVELLRVRRVKP